MSNYREIYRIEQLPIFQNKMFDTFVSALACPVGDMVLVQDLHTGLIFNQAFRAEVMKYGVDYQNEQACSPVFRRHLDDVTKVLLRTFPKENVVEIGCGKGHFLEHLQQSGFQITGFDPAYEGSNVHIVKSVFNRQSHLHTEGIVLRHVLEHIPDPVGFLSEIYHAAGQRGKIYIEVPSFDWIVHHRTWFDIFYEHVNYFQRYDFQRMFGDILEAGYFFGGQYMYLVADLASLQTPEYTDECIVSFPSDFLAAMEIQVERLRGRGTRTAVVWGGASKGVIFSLFMQRAGVPVDMVIDINPAKQGKYIAVSGLQIKSPEAVLPSLESGADIFVMNANYLAEIKAQAGTQFNYYEVDHESIR